MPHTSVTTSSAISRYGDYLEGVYSRSPVSNDGKFPPTPSKNYVNLAVVKRASQIRDIEQVIKNTLHGRVDRMLEEKMKIGLTDILKPQHNGSPVSIVFVEGPPGIGKSTLAWELCRKWDRKQYDLAVLLRLREREVQQINKVDCLFPHEDKHLQRSVTKEVLGREGKGVLFILDGYDELPVKLRHQGLLFKLLKGTFLPNCSVLVTSRPSATRDLLIACSPQIERHVEILGFTQECVKDYASSVFSSEPTMLKDFLTYISASENPAINSLMYIPLNAAIIVHIYRNSRRKGCPIPKTLTQVYTQLCLTLLQRHIETTDTQNKTTLNSFSDISTPYKTHFQCLSQLAFEQFEKERIVFYSDSVSEELVHFGFLDSVSALYGGGGVSYNFLHLTLQEFLAAYHITQFSNGIDVFKHHSRDRRWEVVWRFLSGLTGFKYFENSVQNFVFSSLIVATNVLKVENLFLNCFFEGQVQDIFDCLKTTGINSKTVLSYYQDHINYSPLDRYALGYCIANCSSTTSWEVKIRGGSDESFMWGLNSNHNGNGTISRLIFENFSLTYLASYPMKIFHGIENLQIGLNLPPCGEVIPRMNSLTTLILNYDLEQRKRSIVLASFSNLIHSPKLKCLTIGDDYSKPPITKPLGGILFRPSSLRELTLSGCYLKENCLDSFETNICTYVSTLCLSDCAIMDPPFQILSKILRDRTIQKLHINVTCIGDTLDLEQVDTFKAALSTNTSLEKLKLVIGYHPDNCTHDWSFITDSRVTIECK